MDRMKNYSSALPFFIIWIKMHLHECISVQCFFYICESSLPAMTERLSAKWIYCFAFLTGAIAIISQLSLLREFLFIFHGNELVIGIFLAAWMLLTGIGAASTRLSANDKRALSHLVIIQLLMSLMPLLSYFILHFTCRFMVPEGSLPGLNEAVICSLLVLSPVCILSGFAFVEYCRAMKDAENEIISRVYMTDVTGGVLGGILFNAALMFYLDVKIVLIFSLLLNTIFLFFQVTQIKKYSFLPAVLASFIIIVSFVLYFEGNKSAVQDKFLEEVDTPYGRISVSKTNEQYNFFDNGTLLFSTNYVNENEENVHFAMAQHPFPVNVLLISGGASGMLNEVIKYRPVKIDYVEQDPTMILLARKYTGNIPLMKGLHLITGDARAFVRNTKNRYDVVLITLPEPSTALLSRFYSLEFFRELKTKMNKGAIAATSLPATEDYISREAVPLNSVLFNTMQSVFKNVLIFPGGKNYFLASDSELTLNILQKLKDEKVENLVVNEYYLDETLLKQRSDHIMKSLDRNSKLNTDFRPVVYYYHTQYFLSYFGKQYAVCFLLILLLVLIVAVKPGRINFGMISGGFAATSMELVLIFGMEVIYGNVFIVTTGVITIFMLGMAAGAYLYGKFRKKQSRHFPSILFIIACLALFLMCALNVMNNSHWSASLLIAFFIFLNFSSAFFTGMLFSSASYLRCKSKVSGVSAIYGADLAGSAAGAVLVSSLLLPLYGLNSVCLLTAGLCLLSAFIAISNIRAL